jgi:alpha-beta hydrolase superfamily lysophospholipase
MMHALLLASLGLAAPARPARPTVALGAAVSLVAGDGRALAAAWGVPAKATRGVVFVHMYGRNKEDWNSLAEQLFREGVAVLAVDLRGHGASGAGAALTHDDFTAMSRDVEAAIARLRASGVKDVAVVGAELGANLAINAAVEDAGVVQAVLLSPADDYKGIIASDAVKRYGERPLLIIVANGDTYASRCSAAMDDAAKGPHRLQVYEGQARGTRMLNQEATLEPLIRGWLSTHWTPAKEQPAAAPTAPDVKIDAKKIQTSGPSTLPIVP